MTESPSPSLTVDAAELGPPGVRQELHVLAQMPGEKRSDAKRLRDKSSRVLKISARLAKVPPATVAIRGDFTEKDGSSYLLLPQGAERLRVRSVHGSFDLLKNDAGEVSVVEYECVAKSITEARHKFIRAAMPLLDHLVFLTNAPLFLESIRIVDPKNIRTTVDYTSPYRQAILNPHEAEMPTELEPVYAMYREARNASSNFYRFFCYYKLLEGLLGAVRADAIRRAKAAGITAPRPKVLIPDAPELPKDFQSYVHKSVKVFFDAVLTPQYRIALAHFITDEGVILNVSDPRHIDRYTEIVFMCELCTRAVIANHEALLKTLKASGQ
jgi:hypothetical protein